MKPTLYSGFLSILLLCGCTTDKESRQPDDPNEAVKVDEFAGGSSGSEGEYAPCDSGREELSSFETVSKELGFSVNELLDEIGREHTVSMRWELQDSQPRIPAGEDTLTLTVESKTESATVYYCDDPDYPEELLADQPPRLEVLIDVTLASENGLLDERFETTLIATSLDRAKLTVEVDPDQLKGELGQLVGNFYTSDRREVTFEMALTDQGSAGVIMGPFSPHASSPCRDTNYAVWPADSECWYEAIAEVTDREVMQEYADQLSKEYQLQWNDDSSVNAEIQVSLKGDTTCREQEWAGVRHKIELRITTDDGQLNLTVPGWLVAGPSAYRGEPDEVDVSGTVALDAEALSVRLGYSNSESAAIVSLWLVTPRISNDNDKTSPYGKLKVVAIDRTGFDTPLPLVELPGGDSERCFDAQGALRTPLMQGELNAE